MGGSISPPPKPSYWRKTNPILINLNANLIQFLSNLSKTVPSQKTADIILQMLTLLAFLKQVKLKKLRKIVEIKEVKIQIFGQTS